MHFSKASEKRIDIAEIIISRNYTFTYVYACYRPSRRYPHVSSAEQYSIDMSQIHVVYRHSPWLRESAVECRWIWMPVVDRGLYGPSSSVSTTKSISVETSLVLARSPPVHPSSRHSLTPHGMTPTEDTFGVQLSNEECAWNVRVTSIDRRR